jgi:hypothetical protein
MEGHAGAGAAGCRPLLELLQIGGLEMTNKGSSDNGESTAGSGVTVPLAMLLASGSRCARPRTLSVVPAPQATALARWR